MSNTVVIVPSRLKARRFPNKPLELIDGKEMILHVHDLAKNSGVGDVLIVTPDKDIAQLIKKNGGKRSPQKNVISNFYLNGGAYKIPPSVHKAFRFLPIPSGVSGPIFLSKDSE